MTKNPSLEYILAILRRVSRRYLFAGGAAAVLAAVAVFAGMFALFGVCETFGWFPPAVRTGLFALAFAAPSAVFFSLCARVFLRRPDVSELARMVERRWPEFRERLVSAVQLGFLAEAELRGQSPELVRALVVSALRELEPLPVERAVPSRSLVLAARAAGFMVVLALLLPVLSSRVASGYIRLADHSAVYLRPDSVIIHTGRRDASIIRGDDFVTPGVLAGYAGPLTLLYRPDGAVMWISRPVEVNPRTGAFTVTVEKPRRSFAWRLEAGSHRTPGYRVTVIERPVIEKLTVTLRYPAHTGLGTVTRMDGDGNIRALRGTVVTLAAEVNKPLRGMTLRWGDSTVVRCAVSGRTGTASFRVAKDADYRFSLTDTLGIGDIDPITYHIAAVDDEKPSVTVLSPAEDISLPRSMRFPMVYRASDDYGLSRVSIVAKLPQDGSPRTLVLKQGRLPREIGEEYPWDLSDLNVLPGDMFTWYLSVFDNDAVSGPKEAVSETFTVRVPSLVEWMNEAADGQEKAEDRLRDVRKESAEGNAALGDVRRNLLDGRKMDWADKNALAEAEKRSESMRKEVKNLAEEIRKTAKALDEEDLAALETVEKLEKIARMMDEIADGELKEALRRLTQANLQMDPRAMKDALDQYAVTAEAVQNKLDNLIALLDRVKSLQRFETARKAAEDLAVRQAELTRKYREHPDDPGLAREQESLAAETEKLRDELKDAAKGLREKFSLNTKEFEKFLDSDNTPETMRETARNMKKGMTERARNGMDAANAGMSEMLGRMDALDAAMRGTNTARMRERLLTAMTELLAVSREQEAFLGEFGRSGGAALAKRQLDILGSYEKAARTMSELGSLSTDLAAMVDQIAGKPRAVMKAAVDQLSASNGKAGEQFARNALATLNGTVLLLTKMLRDSGQGGGKGSAGDLMEQLQGIAGGQQALQMRTGGAGADELMRLAAEQRKLAEMLSRLGRGVSDDKRLREMLGKIAGDMDETARMMRRNEPRERIERRQLDSYRRLLDARRSRKERDGETPERKSWAAKRNESRGSVRLDDDLGQRNAEISARLKQALGEDFGPEYLTRIRQYFESLLKSGAEGGTR